MIKKDQFFAVSFMTTHFSRLKQHWKHHSKLEKNGILGTDRKPAYSLGGKVIILEWNSKKIIWELLVDIPTGICIEKNLLFINSLKNQIVCVDKSKNVIDCIKNKKFNSLHSLNKTENGFLLTSSGLDLILEINDSGNSIFEWWATEHGFNKTPSGIERVIDKNKDHSIEIYPTLSQTTHINSAINYEQNNILATLFHQGVLIKINKNDGSYVNLLDGLSKPHAIYNTQDGFLLSDTCNNRSLILNREFKVVNEINEKFKWVQDTILESNGNFIVADADNNRMVEVSIQDKINSPISIYNFNKEWRIFQTKEISRDQFNEFFK